MDNNQTINCTPKTKIKLFDKISRKTDSETVTNMVGTIQTAQYFIKGMQEII